MTPRPVTLNLIDAMVLDIWPRPAAVCDFGIETEAHYRVLHKLVRCGELKTEALDAALGDGPALTRLVNACPSNPAPGIVFRTPYDGMEPA